MIPTTLNKGDRVKGQVAQIASFGAFIDFGGWQGLVRVAEMSWLRFQQVADVLTVGQEVETEVLIVDRERNQVLLSIKRCQENPWIKAAAQYQIGQDVQTVVSRISTIAIFACLQDHPAIEGALRIAEGNQRDFMAGQVITLRIAKFVPEQERILFQMP